MNKPLLIGKFVGTHGLHGDIKMQVYTDSVSMLKKLKTISCGVAVYVVEAVREHKNVALFKLTNIDTPEAAHMLIGQDVYADREDLPPLPEGRYYAEDIIGLSVISTEGENLGKITDVFSTGSNDVYEITNETKKKTLIPAIRDVVKNIDLDAQMMTIWMMPGLFDDEN
ncbi:MAG: 16S rRNA processing protein RimM [Clostridia bacterium]|nr:16S rRNA processing protein RimM [Clostridia bacterium]